MQETRVNLKHLLEDIRDSYAMPIEEAIVTELVANALDSRASRIDFFLDLAQNKFTICDNGQGMKRKEMKDYHNIATTTKVKGKGIGFAGIGAKLSLLITNSVITETKGGRGSHCATQWYLQKENRAPWKFISSPGKVTTPRGTAITLQLSNSDHPLLSLEFVSQAIKKHYYPLLDPQFINNSILKTIYKKGINFFINERRLVLSPDHLPQVSRSFQVSLGKRWKKLAGFGYLAKTNFSNFPGFSGISISTYGKVIKQGWEWIGIWPKSLGIYGTVEIPILSEILTTNKNDFMRDASSLKKYYKYRKAIQEAVLPILDELGEKRLFFESDLKRLRPLEKDIERTLRYILGDFPELTSLVGIKTKALIEEGIIQEEKRPQIEFILKSGEVGGEEKKEGESKFAPQPRKIAEPKPKSPGLSIGFEEDFSQLDLARMIKNTIWINTSHPGYQKAKKENLEEYHILLCVAWVLSRFIEENHSPQDFINQFLRSWAQEDKKTLQMLKKT